MATLDRKAFPDVSPETRKFAAAFLRAFIEADTEVQNHVRELIKIATSVECSDYQRDLALGSIQEALMPVIHDNKLGVSIQEADQIAVEDRADGRAAYDRLRREESEFADRLSRLMDAKGLNQAALAEKAGMTQPAISLFLKRKCRPQQRTIAKLAMALEVEKHELWPWD